MKTIELILDHEMEGKTLEKLMKEELGLTKKQIRSAKFREQGICINGIRQRATAWGRAGDCLSVCLEEDRRDTGKVLPVTGALEILYEDGDVIAVNKPGGIPCHPGRGHYRDSLANRLAAYLQEKGESTLLRPVGRLDKDTSGVMVYAKSTAAAARLFSQKEQGIFEKEYLALAEGKMPESQEILSAPIGKMPGEKLKMQVSGHGKPALTKYRVLREREGYSLLRCRIFTGRTHQIRVHLSWTGHPIVGDVLYGNGENREAQGLALHSGKAVFCQPFTGERILVSAPVPAVFPAWCREDYPEERTEKETGRKTGKEEPGWQK